MARFYCFVCEQEGKSYPYYQVENSAAYNAEFDAHLIKAHHVIPGKRRDAEL